MTHWVQLSNGDVYDKNRSMYIQYNQNKPAPHNRKQTLLLYLNVKNLVDLTDDELAYLIQEVRSFKPPCVKNQQWYKNLDHNRRREYMTHQLKHDYYWEVSGKINLKYTKEQLAEMPWAESRYKKHERLLGPTFWEWVEQSRPNQWHALWGKRDALPGVIKSQRRKNRHLSVAKIT